jgi:U3 small nucleolar ribonucleoprotein component
MSETIFLIKSIAWHMYEEELKRERKQERKRKVITRDSGTNTAMIEMCSIRNFYVEIQVNISLSQCQTPDSNPKVVS